MKPDSLDRSRARATMLEWHAELWNRERDLEELLEQGEASRERAEREWPGVLAEHARWQHALTHLALGGAWVAAMQAARGELAQEGLTQ